MTLEGKSSTQVTPATQTTYHWLATQPNLIAIPVDDKSLTYTISGKNNVVFVSTPN